MIAKTIKFQNFLEQDEVETFHFNMSKGELTILQLQAIDQRTESLQDKLEKIGKSLQGKELADVLDELIMNTIGEKSTDGKKFIKNEQIREDFKSSGAWSELVSELCSDADAMSEFVNGLMPKNLRNEVQKTLDAKSARERSEANLQGHKKPAPSASVKTVPELPTVIENTAEPVLLGESDTSNKLVVDGSISTVDDAEARAFAEWKASQAATKAS